MFVPYGSPFTSQQFIPYHPGPSNGLYHSGISPMGGYPGIGFSPMAQPGYYGYRPTPMIPPYGYGYGYGGYGLAHAGIEGGIPGGIGIGIGPQGYNTVGQIGGGFLGYPGYGVPMQPAWSGGPGFTGGPGWSAGVGGPGQAN